MKYESYVVSNLVFKITIINFISASDTTDCRVQYSAITNDTVLSLFIIYTIISSAILMMS